MQHVSCPVAPEHERGNEEMGWAEQTVRPVPVGMGEDVVLVLVDEAEFEELVLEGPEVAVLAPAAKLRVSATAWLPPVYTVWRTLLAGTWSAEKAEEPEYDRVPSDACLSGVYSYTYKSKSRSGVTGRTAQCAGRNGTRTL